MGGEEGEKNRYLVAVRFHQDWLQYMTTHGDHRVKACIIGPLPVITMYS